MNPISHLLISVINVYIYIVIASAIVSWLIAFNVINTSNRFVYAITDVLYRLTEPALAPIRRFMPRNLGVDISPIILFILLEALQYTIYWVDVRLL